MKTSLIIPSYNPALKLPQTLAALIIQREWIDELIVVVDQKNYSEDVKLMLEAYSDKFNLKIITQDVSGRARSRNKGAEVSSNELLIFLDDDMLAENDLMKRHIQYHIKTPDTIVSGNGYRNPEDASDDFRKFLVNMEKGWKAQNKPNGEVTLSNFNFTACNMSLPKKVFEQLNGFDIRFSDGEDFDFAVQAINKGGRIIYDNALLAWHNDWPEIAAYIKRQIEYTNSKREIFRTHPEYLEDFSKMLPQRSSSIKRIIAFLFKSSLVWFVASDNVIFAILPTKVKFILYNLTITFNSIVNSKI